MSRLLPGFRPAHRRSPSWRCCGRCSAASRSCRADRFELEVYRDQLAEVERDRERGLIRPERRARRGSRSSAGCCGSPAAVEAPARRRPAAGRGAGAGGGAAGADLAPHALRRPRLAAACPTSPLAQRQEPPPAIPSQPDVAADGGAGLEARLATVAGRSRGLADARPVAGGAGQSPGAVEAFRRAQALAPNDPGAIGGLGRGADDGAGGVMHGRGQGACSSGWPRSSRATRGRISIWAGPTSRPASHQARPGPLAPPARGDPGRRALAPAGGRGASRPRPGELRPRPDDGAGGRSPPPPAAPRPQPSRGRGRRGRRCRRTSRWR